MQAQRVFAIHWNMGGVALHGAAQCRTSVPALAVNADRSRIVSLGFAVHWLRMNVVRHPIARNGRAGIGERR